MHMLRAAAFGFLLIPAAATAQPGLPTRVTIPTFIVSPSGDVAEQITAWKNLLQGDMSALAGELTALPNAQRIQFSERRVSSTPTLQTVQDRWRQLNALQVITAIGSGDPRSVAFEGSIYLGNLGSGIPAQTVPLPRSLTASDYQQSRDTVRAATLYALSVDAGTNRVIACQLLRRASQAARDLARRNSAGGLRVAIDQRRTSLHCGIVR
jgi:hypothetical protein